MTELDNISPTDELRLQLYRNTGEQLVIGELFNQYMHLVYGLCLKYLKDHEASQDAVMDIYETISKKLLKTEVKHFKSWLYMVSKNHCLMILRKNNPEVNTEIIMESPDVMHLKEEKINLEQDLNALDECIEKLNAEQRKCVKHFFLFTPSVRWLRRYAPRSVGLFLLCCRSLGCETLFVGLRILFSFSLGFIRRY